MTVLEVFLKLGTENISTFMTMSFEGKTELLDAIIDPRCFRSQCVCGFPIGDLIIQALGILWKYLSVRTSWK